MYFMQLEVKKKILIIINSALETGKQTNLRLSVKYVISIPISHCLKIYFMQLEVKIFSLIITIVL